MIQGIREQFKAKLEPTGWLRVLEEFIDSHKFSVLMNQLIAKKVEGVLTPDLNQVFRAFYECPYDKLNTVLVNLDPYPEEGEADGLAFSCGNTNDVQPQLHVIFTEVQKTVYRYDNWYAWEPDLIRWAKQGVLLLNLSMTTEIDKIGVHKDIWKPFIDYLFQKLIDMNTGLIYIFIGLAASDWAKKIPESNYKFFCYHPNAALISGDPWNSNEVFVRVNELLESNNGLKIIW